MMTMMNKHCLLLFVVAICGCALLAGCMMGTQYSPPTQQQLATTGYGAPLTIDYKNAIKAYFLDKLKDPR
jgi:hypothetical protein